jgi:hypothetical protein
VRGFANITHSLAGASERNLVDRLVHIDEPCVVIGWRILLEGRKCHAGTALYDEDCERCAVGVATWVVPATAP